MSFCWTVRNNVFMCIQLFATPWTVAHQAHLSMGSSQKEYWNAVAIFFSRGSSWSRDRTCVSWHFFPTEPSDSKSEQKFLIKEGVRLHQVRKHKLKSSNNRKSQRNMVSLIQNNNSPETEFKDMEYCDITQGDQIPGHGWTSTVPGLLGTQPHSRRWVVFFQKTGPWCSKDWGLLS